MKSNAIKLVLIPVFLSIGIFFLRGKTAFGQDCSNPEGSNVSFTWAAPITGSVPVNYRFYYAQAPSFEAANQLFDQDQGEHSDLIGSATPAYSLTNLIPGCWYVAVSAIDAMNREGLRSPYDCFTVVGTHAGTSRPPDPENLGINSTGSRKALVSWESMGGTTSTFIIAKEELGFSGSKPSNPSHNVASCDQGTSVGRETSYTLEGLNPDSDYAVRVCAKSEDGLLSEGTLKVFKTAAMPVVFSPNPLRTAENGNVRISYSVGRPGHTELAIYNVRGELVKIVVYEDQPHGVKEINWNGKDETGAPLPSGVYIYKFISPNNIPQTGKITILK